MTGPGSFDIVLIFENLNLTETLQGLRFFLLDSVTPETKSQLNEN